MSRVGSKPVAIPSGVKTSVSGGSVNIEGAKGKLAMTIPAFVDVEVKDAKVSVSRKSDERQAKANQGLARSLINNMITGVTKGFTKELQIIGVGYRAQLAGAKLTLSLGFSHPVVYDVPAGIKVAVNENTKIVIDGIDKQLVGEVAATIRRFRPPEPYKGKGIRYAGEHITLKEGKTVGK
jgi:large subunit ribosomal protein L6